ncbi:MAG: polysaccharide lyase [Rhizobiaceae bacterium]|nr:polysaccharide lyase [Rhizobiaceae bacterium]
MISSCRQAQAALSANEAPGLAKLRDDFEGTDFSPDGGLYYRLNAEQRAGSVEFQGSDVFSGKRALKLSVDSRKLENGVECERAEIWERTDLRVPYNQGVWYGFAFKLADPIPTDDHRYLIAQWKREILPGASGDFSPFLALRLRHGKLHMTVETNFRPPLDGCPVDGKGKFEGVPVFMRPEKNQMRALVATDPGWTPQEGKLYTHFTDRIAVANHGNSLPPPDTGWIDLVVYSKPGPGGDGRIEIYANSRPVATVTGMIGHGDPGLGSNQYFKFGPYRSRHTGKWSIYYDEFRRSPDRADVLA